MLSLSPSDRRDLAIAVDREIEKAFSGLGGTLPPGSKTEAMGILLSDALPAVADHWRPVLAQSGVVAKIYAAFTFSAPVAEVRMPGGDTRRHDVGDVLLLVDDLSGAQLDRRAVLLSTGLLSTGPTARTAWLQTGALFRLTEMSTAAPDRSLRAEAAPGRAEAGMAHAQIDLASGAVTVAGIGVEPRERVSFGAALLAVATGEAGRPATGGGADDWSATVDDLLRATLRATSSGLAQAGGPNRTITRHKGECGTGFVVFDLRRPVTSEGGEAQPRADGPLPIVHVVFSAAPGDAARPGPDRRRIH